jgi:hypothetical protein
MPPTYFRLQYWGFGLLNLVAQLVFTETALFPTFHKPLGLASGLARELVWKDSLDFETPNQLANGKIRKKHLFHTFAEK